MTKEEIVGRVAEHAGITKKAAAQAVDAFTDAIRAALAGEAGRIHVAGIGTFRVATTKTRIGRNPRTKQRIKIRSKRVPRFSAAQALRRLVRNSDQEG